MEIPIRGTLNPTFGPETGRKGIEATQYHIECWIHQYPELKEHYYIVEGGRSEENGPNAVTGIEANPGFPQGSLFGKPWSSLIWDIKFEYISRKARKGNGAKYAK